MHSRHTRLQSILEERLGTEAARLFSRPKVSEDAPQGKAEAVWFTDVETELQPFSALDEEQQRQCAERLLPLLLEIEELAESLDAESSKTLRNTGQLLRLAMNVPGIDSVFCGGDAIVLAHWGFIQDSGQGDDFSLIGALRKLAGNESHASAAQLGQAADQEPEQQEPGEQSQQDEPEKDKETERTKDSAVSTEETIQQKDAAAKETPQEGAARQDQTESRESQPLFSFGEEEFGPVRSPLVTRRRISLFMLLATVVLLSLWFFWPESPLLPKHPGFAPPAEGSITVDKADPLGRTIVANQLLVDLAFTTTPQKFARIVKLEYPDASLEFLGYHPEINAVQLQVPAEKRDLWIERLLGMPDVAHAEAVEIYTVQTVPNDPGFKDEQKNHWGHERINAFAAWEETMGSEETLIAIIDAGFDVNHPELRSQIRGTWNALTGGKNVAGSDATMRHGTHLAALAAGRADNNRGVSGVCPQCSLLLIKAADNNRRFSGAMIRDAVIHAVNQGARVVNLSVGAEFTRLGSVFSNKSPAEQRQLVRRYVQSTESRAKSWDRLFAYAASMGSVVIQAAGNEGVPAELDAMKRSPESIVVAASDDNDLRAEFSNFGTAVTVSAPGVQIYSAMPQRQFGFQDGTSTAAAIVSGAMGCLLSRDPSLSFDVARQALLTTGVPISQPVDEHVVGPRLNLAALVNFERGQFEQQPQSQGLPAAQGGQQDTPAPPPDVECLCGEELAALQRELKTLRRRLIVCQSRDQNAPSAAPTAERDGMDAEDTTDNGNAAGNDTDNPGNDESEQVRDEVVLQTSGESARLALPAASTPAVEQGTSLEAEGNSPGAPHPLRVNLSWDASSSAGNAVDLDLGCMYETVSGEKGVLQALDRRFGTPQAPPYIYLDKDVRGGNVHDGENLTILHPELLQRMLIYVYIYKGIQDFSGLNARLTITDPHGKRVQVPLNNPRQGKRFCAVCALVPREGSLTVSKEEFYASRTRELDERYGFGFQWRNMTK